MVFPSDDDQSVTSIAGREAPTCDFRFARSRKRDLLDEQRSRWAEGRPAPPEDFLRAWPADPSHDPDAASVLLEDYFQRRNRGDEAASLIEYRERFSELGDSLNSMASQHSLFRSLGKESSGSGYALRLPGVGDELFGFRLRHPLGSGAFARVFLAEQADLAGRPVVLKVSAIEGTEPQTLAQLQHTNIVPIYSLHDDLRAGLRAVCMPYFGGASLSGVLERLWAETPRPEHGAQFVAALKAVQAPTLDALNAARDGGGGSAPAPAAEATAGDPAALADLAGLGYTRLAAWVVARLADGLQHAHDRGVLHRDIKPSNVLVAADGQPLLLDFNLAQNRAEDAAHATIGGTVAYMAPEHLRALVGRTSELVSRVDQRSDVYSLGMVLAEMLTGHRPFEQSGSYSMIPLQIEAMALERTRDVPSLRAQRPDIPWGLESIARKCLDPDPGRRYQRADQLADDLRRFIDDRPLRYAPELSRVEQARKFLRRHPRVASSGSIAATAAVLLLAVGWALAGVRGHLARARAEIGVTQARDRLKAHEAGTVRALCLVNTALETQDHLRDGAAVCERTLALYGPPESADWSDHPDYRRLGADDRRRLAEDRRELLMLLAGARVRLAPGDRAALRRALVLLDRAEAIDGLEPAKALWIDRADYLERLGDPKQARAVRKRAEQVRATTARDHYLLATAYARRGGADGLGRAVRELDEAIRLNPNHYWSLVQRGICHLERKHYLLAASDFGRCTGLWPEFAWGYFNRGYVLALGGDREEAVNDYTAALARDPGFLPAYVNRGLLLLELRRYEPALADFDKAAALGRRDASLDAGRGMALEALGRHAEADAAFARAFAEAPPPPDPSWLRMEASYGFAVAARAPSKARAAFDEVLAHDPRDPRALYGRAMLAMGEGRLSEALRAFDRAVAADPGLVEARRYRGVAHARKGNWDSAGRDINWCLEREPESAATLYSAACVASLAADALADPATADQALDLFRRAVRQGVDPRRAEADPDMASLRKLPKFTRLMAELTGPRS